MRDCSGISTEQDSEADRGSERLNLRPRGYSRRNTRPRNHIARLRSTTTLHLREIVRRFVDERDWRQFHSPKNLSMSLAIEAAELMEHFQWIDIAESRRIGDDPAKLAAVGEEIADVLCYLLALANELKLDLSAVRDKMVKNAVKYPAEQAAGATIHRRNKT